jgi:dihydroflavonol-4-reductase
MELFPQQSVLVTGASGFIGTRLAHQLMARHCRVTCLVRVHSRTDQLRSIGARLVTGDVTDRRSVERALTQAQADTVFHLAGLVKARHREDFMRVNAGGVESVAAACADRASPPILVVVSSLAAAGPCAASQVRVEADSPAPASSYGRSKLAGEQAAARYAGVVPITLVRPPIVFGPGDRAMLEVFRPIARWGFHVVQGRTCGGESADRRYSLIYVDDLVEGLLLAAGKGGRLREQGSSPMDGRGIYHIAGEEHPTYTQLGQIIADVLGKKPPTIIHLPGPLLRLAGIGGDIMARIRGRAGWVSSDKITEFLAGSWMCASTKARTHLNWAPQAALRERLHQTAQWYRQAGWL